MKKILLFILLTILPSIYLFPQNNKLEVGADRLISDYFYLIKGKRIGLVTNESGVLSNGVALVDTLSKMKDTKVTAIFGPEHGFRGNAPAGKHVGSVVDAKTGIPVFSLYGKNFKPSAKMLKNVDVLVYDIQCVGARFYTFISTLFYVEQAAAENHIPIIVLDRPDPITGVEVEGPVRQKDEASFVGIAPIPIRYGMTIGELAEYYAGEGLLGKNLKPQLTVVKMKNWNRKYYIDHYSLPWIKPSPNIPDLETAIVYPGMCLIEGTNVSEGRGTYHPFLHIGAPYINSSALIKKMNSYKVKGVQLEPLTYTPVSIPGMSTSPKYLGKKCKGISIKVINREEFKPVSFGIKLVCALHSLYPEKFKFRASGFDRLSGDKTIREKILAGQSPDEIINSWQNELENFLKIRKKYLLY